MAFYRAFVGFLCASSLGMATTVYGTSAAGELTGNRDSTSGDVTEVGSLATAFDISWVITLTDGVYQYTYTITGPAGSGLGVSHFALNLANTCSTDVSCVTNATVNSVDVEAGLVFGNNTSANGDPNF